MKRTLLRNKNKKHPTNPSTLDDIAEKFMEPSVLEKYGMNSEGDGKFYIDTVVEEDYGFTVFASKYVIDFIQEHIPPNKRHYLMDGTFDSLPNEYYQLLIIAIEHENDVSNVYAYLSNRPSVRLRTSSN